MADARIPLHRLLSLRQFPALASVELVELVMVAENVVESTFPAGASFATADARVAALHLVLDGRIETRQGTAVETWGPRQVFGILEVLAGRAAVASAISATTTRTLRLSAGDTIEVLEDNFGLLRVTLRELAARLVGYGDHPREQAHQFGFPSTGELTLVERLIVLRQHVPFVGGRLQALAAVAHAAEEMSWPAGITVAQSGSMADAAIMIVEGTLRATRPDGVSRILRAGDAIGPLETLAGMRHGSTVETTSPVRAISCSGAAILDVLEDHTDLGLMMIASFAGALLDRARAPAVVNGEAN